jgi:hypothetical protein
MDVEREAWCRLFADVLVVIDGTVTRTEAEWTAQVVYPSAFNMTSVQAVWVYMGMNERRQRPRSAATDASD